jgi:hypothetical protein
MAVHLGRTEEENEKVVLVVVVVVMVAVVTTMGGRKNKGWAAGFREGEGKGKGMLGAQPPTHLDWPMIVHHQGES